MKEDRVVAWEIDQEVDLDHLDAQIGEIVKETGIVEVVDKISSKVSITKSK